MKTEEVGLMAGAPDTVTGPKVAKLLVVMVVKPLRVPPVRAAAADGVKASVLVPDRPPENANEPDAELHDRASGPEADTAPLNVRPAAAAVTVRVAVLRETALGKLVEPATLTEPLKAAQ